MTSVSDITKGVGRIEVVAGGMEKIEEAMQDLHVTRTEYITLAMYDAYTLRTTTCADLREKCRSVGILGVVPPEEGKQALIDRLDDHYHGEKMMTTT